MPPPARKTSTTRWPRRARRRFAGHAEKVDAIVSKHAKPLATKLSDARDAIEKTILSALTIEKAQSDVVSASITSKQYLALRAAIEAIDDDAYADAIYIAMTLLAEVGWSGARELLEISEGFDVPPTWAIEQLKTTASDYAKSLVEKDQKTLYDVLDRALVEGLSAKDTAKALQASFASGVTIYDGDGRVKSVQNTASYFSTVARTELQRAAVAGQVELYKAADIKTVRWQAAAPCDECEDADGEVENLGDNFPGVDVDAPPAHPNCRCVLVPADDDLGDHRGTEEDRANARRGNQPESKNDDDGDGVVIADGGVTSGDNSLFTVPIDRSTKR